ncbi:ankyrin repeat domain-containing protein [Mycobacterium barrassiae]|uniref:ankyrin repeat domain-containing protein n=1 Tax=Mycobacterium barrassiae TaxID=319709 RepID=UPI002265981E|nr:ankyrin repeat domain-containing protein [Mycobacterium barrassiae]MCV7298822.1 ankyrin repeat domain-containing protein [Mycobacterium barrassiae]
MTEIAHYQDGQAEVSVSRDGDDLTFVSAYEDFGRTVTEESRIPADEFVIKGPGPWPWFDLGTKRAGALLVLDALEAGRPAWTEPLHPTVLDLFERAHRGDTRVIELLAMGADPDPLDPCGATPLWYAVRSPAAGNSVALIDEDADAGRRIELSARGERFTTILHEIVRRGRTVALNHALAHGVDPSLVDSDGATPMHVIEGSADNVNPEIVRALVRAGASIDAPLPSGTQPIELAARMLLPATVAAMIELSADPGRGLDSLLAWWAVGAKFNGYRSGRVVELIDILRAGGAEVSPRHRELAADAAAPDVEAALRR